MMMTTDQALYDDLYSMDDETHRRLVLSYMPLFQRVTEIVVSKRMSPVLEVGCGRGVFAELLIAAGIGYRGFDFHENAVDLARKRNGAERRFSPTPPARQPMPCRTTG
jgi:2-polyprenyl-3-methyl-5-hydroxy-6-metoxy-1,4-benzoquinol methylase